MFDLFDYLNIVNCLDYLLVVSWNLVSSILFILVSSPA